MRRAIQASVRSIRRSSWARSPEQGYAWRSIAVAETLHFTALVFGLFAPLAYFFVRVSPEALPRLAAILGDRAVRSAAANTLVLSGITGVLSTSLAFLFSWILWRYRWPSSLKRAIELCLKTPYLLPPFFLAMGWIALAAPGAGYLAGFHVRLFYGLPAAIFVLTCWAAALAMIQLQGFFARHAGILEDAALLCGASPARAFRYVTIPLALPYLGGCLLLTTAGAAAAFGVPALLASPARSFVLTTRIYQKIREGDGLAEAGVLSAFLVALSAILIGAQAVLAKRAKMGAASGKTQAPAALEPCWGARAGLAAAAVFGAFSCVLPLGAVAIQSLLADRSNLRSWSLAKYAYVFGKIPDGLDALGNSLVVSGIAAASVTVLGLLLAYGAARLRRRSSIAMMEAWGLGYAVPGTVLALALLLFFGSTLANTLAILVVAYSVKYAAFALRALAPAIGAVAPELEEAGWMCGASPLSAFARLLIPLLKPAVAAALFLAFVPMLSELTMSVFLVGPGTETVGTLIYRLQEYADPGAAAVLAITVTAAILALNAGLRRLSNGRFGI